MGAEEVDFSQNWALKIATLNHKKLPITVCGEACEAVLSELLAAQQNAREANVSMQNVANAIAQLGAIKAMCGESDDAMTLQPLYIGVSNAERVLNERLANERVTDKSVANNSVMSQSSTR